MTYPTYDECGETPEPYNLARAILLALGARTAPLATSRSQETAPTKRPHRKNENRVYASQYVGVCRWKRGNGGWYGQWRDARTKWRQGPVRQSELEAAWDRARALGLPDVELRDS